LNILLVTSHLEIGGVGIYTASLAKALKERGENVIVASGGGMLVDRLANDKITHVHVPLKTSAEVGLHMFMAYFKLSGLIKEQNVEIVHAQTRVSQVIGYFLAKRHGIAFITTCHGFFKKRLARRLFPCWGNSVIAISDAVREHLVNDMQVPKESVRLIYNGIDLNRFSRRYSQEERQIIRKDYDLTDAPTVGLVARLSRVKGHKYLLRAFAKVKVKMPKVQLLVIGDGPKSYLKELRTLTQQLQIEKDTHFHKACEDTTAALSIIDMFCMPSTQEGLGLSILEAMAMERPVVASNVGGIYSLIKDRHNGLLVPPHDEDALAEAILHILSNPSMAKEMGRLSKQMVEEKFTLDIAADNILQLYKQTLGLSND